MKHVQIPLTRVSGNPGHMASLWFLSSFFFPILKFCLRKEEEEIKKGTFWGRKTYQAYVDIGHAENGEVTTEQGASGLQLSHNLLCVYF